MKHFFVLQFWDIMMNHNTVAIVYEWFGSLLFIIDNILAFISSIWVNFVQ